MPRKLASTFNYTGAPAHYLHTSNAAVFAYEDKLRLGAAELVWERIVLLLALLGVARSQGPLQRLRQIICAAASLWVFMEAAWIAHLGLAVATLLFGKTLLNRPLPAVVVAIVLTTGATHAVFFGAGRYALVCTAVLCALAALAFSPRFFPASGALTADAK
jgi:hypothetical protein